jgi:hypothetical protein
MPGALSEWPAWPEFVSEKQQNPFRSGESSLKQDEDCRRTKDAIIKEYGRESLQQSWIQTCEELKEVTEQISLQGSGSIPILDMEDIAAGAVTDETKSKLRKSGCFIVRNVIEKTLAQKLFAELKEYTACNKGCYSAWPVDAPAIYNLYNTPSQNAVRTHPSHLKLVRWINNLWHWSEESTDVSADPLVYADAVRMRPGGSPFLGLGPHIDAGSLCRWADPQYRQVYRAIFSGKPLEQDCFDLDTRKNADQVLFPGRAHSTVLRAFQGWTAFSRTSPRQGTILLYPNVRTAISYLLLRPFFRPPQDPSQIMDASQWEFDAESTWFPGTFKQESQRLSDSSHPHLRLKECLVHVPELQPGDTVWWHTDVSKPVFLLKNDTKSQQVCHAVDPEHVGNDDASVVYIAATPTTATNKEYMQKQFAEMVRGLPPADHKVQGSDESQYVGFQGFSAQPDLFRQLMGF